MDSAPIQPPYINSSPCRTVPSPTSGWACLFHGRRHRPICRLDFASGHVVLRARHLARGCQPTVSYGSSLPTQPAPNEVNHPGVIPYGCDCNNLAPNGARLPPSGASGVLRAGYGLQYGPILASTYAWIRSTRRPTRVQAIQQPDLIQALTAASGTSFMGAAQGAISSRFSIRTWCAYSRPVNFSWERDCALWHMCNWLLGSRTFKLISRDPQPRADLGRLTMRRGSHS